MTCIVGPFLESFKMNIRMMLDDLHQMVQSPRNTLEETMDIIRVYTASGENQIKEFKKNYERVLAVDELRCRDSSLQEARPPLKRVAQSKMDPS